MMSSFVVICFAAETMDREQARRDAEDTTRRDIEEQARRQQMTRDAEDLARQEQAIRESNGVFQTRLGEFFYLFQM